MKKIAILMLVLITLATSCYEDQMNFFPSDKITPDKVFSTEGTAESALLGTYARFSPGWYKYYIVFLEYYGNKDFSPGGQSATYSIFSTHVFSSANSSIKKGYKRLWAVIIYANTFINNVQETPFRNPERKLQAIAEARFLRAWSYFQLVQLWGPVPLVTDKENYQELYPYNSTVENLYEQIIDDLEFCVDILPEKFENIVSNTVESARARKAAAQGILAKVLMTAPEGLKDLQKASDLIKSIIDNPNFELLDNFDDLWNKENTDNSEQLFTAAFSDQGHANGIDFSVYLEQGLVSPAKRFYNSFDSDSIVVTDGDTVIYNDERRDASIYYEPISKQRRDNKYRRSGLGTSTNSSNPNVYVLRLADIILLRAEVLNSISYDANRNEIVNMINLVRNRAGAIPTSLEECYDAKSTALIIEEERHKELFFEFQEWYDLKRTGRAIEVLGKNGADLGLDEAYQLLWPIPISEMTKNVNLVQNPEY